MSENYGENITRAMRAVLQMHADSSKLLLDLDREMMDYVSLYDNIATANLSYDVKSKRFMAEGLFRHYVRAKTDTEVIAVNILFFDEGIKTAFSEPLFVASKLSYLNTTGSSSERQSRFWNPWQALTDWSHGEALKGVVHLSEIKKSGEVQSATVRAVPLFGISSIEQAMYVMREVAPELVPSPEVQTVE